MSSDGGFSLQIVGRQNVSLIKRRCSDYNNFKIAIPILQSGPCRTPLVNEQNVDI